MGSLVKRVAAWYQLREERARRRHLVHTLAIVAEESRRLGQLELAELIFLSTDMWADGYGPRARQALERVQREIDAEIRFGTNQEGGL